MDENKLNGSDKIKIIILALLVVAVTISGLTYAYFTIQVSGNETASSIRIKTANLSLIYTDVQIKSGRDIAPEWNETKTISVENDGNTTVDYIIKWREIQNTITNGELVLTATCVSNIQGNTCSNIPETPLPSATTAITDAYVYGPVSIEPNEIHTYTVTVRFKDTGSEQNYNQRKSFYGTLNIGDGTATNELLFEYETENNEVTITKYNGIEITYDIDESACQSYIESWEDEAWDSQMINDFCAGTGTDPYDGNTLSEWISMEWIAEDEYEDFGLSNMDISRVGPADVIIPREINGNPVKTISDQAFYRNQLTSVIIPDSVTTIGVGAFESNQLTSVVIPDSVTTIEASAFYYNQLTSIVIPNTLVSIGETAFADNQLMSVKLSNASTTIGNGAFSGNQLTSIIIPNGTTAISSAFYNNQLTSVIIPDSVTTIEGGAFNYNQLASVIIPNGVTTIGSSAFSNNQLTSVIIPDSVTTIEGGAFNYNQLTSVVIPNGVTTIESRAFSNNQLTSVIIPNSVTTIYGLAFENNPITSLTVDMTNIPDNFFKKGTAMNFVCGSGVLTNLTLGANVKTIGTSAFYNNQLTSVVIPNGVTTIGSSAFYNNQLTSVIISNTVTSIGREAFSGNQLTSVTIPSSVTKIYDSAFYYFNAANNTLESVTIEGKSSSSEFATYGINIWGWASDVTCVKNNTSNVTNGCITWEGSGS